MQRRTYIRGGAGGCDRGTRVRIAGTSLSGRTGTIVDYSGNTATVRLNGTEHDATGVERVEPRHLEKMD